MRGQDSRSVLLLATCMAVGTIERQRILRVSSRLLDSLSAFTSDMASMGSEGYGMDCLA